MGSIKVGQKETSWELLHDKRPFSSWGWARAKKKWLLRHFMPERSPSKIKVPDDTTRMKEWILPHLWRQSE
jgi:hypothetical protein